jgi:hypothetical protein
MASFRGTELSIIVAKAAGFLALAGFAAAAKTSAAIAMDPERMHPHRSAYEGPRT